MSCGLSVTLHPAKPEALITSSDLILFNIHENPYCVYVKSFRESHSYCINRQYRILRKCKNGSFCGSCYAGVREYIYPINNGLENIGFICVSGYKSANHESYLHRTSEKFNIPIDNLYSMYQSLSCDMPSKNEIDTLIIPLCNMLELAYRKAIAEETDNNLITTQIIRFVKLHYTQGITIDDICRELGYSRSYVSHHFKRNTGKSFREYIIDLRINYAKSLLQYSKLSVTDISLSAGFCDSTYFSNTFKKITGISPSAYRKQYELTPKTTTK